MTQPRIKHQLDGIKFLGARLVGGEPDFFRAKVVENIIDADLSLGADAVTEMTLAFADPGLELAKSGIATMHARITYDDLVMLVAALEVNPGPAGTGGFTMTARSHGVARLKGATGPLVMRNASPTDFVRAECKAVGLKVKAQATAVRTQVARDVKKKGEGELSSSMESRPSSWTTFQRLAKEVGFYVFEVAGTVYFGQPSWLIEQAEEVEVTWLGGEDSETRALSVPTCRKTVDGEGGAEITFEVPYTRARQMRPGRAVRLRGVPGFNGVYLITNVDYSLAGLGPVTVTAKTPIDPTPEPAADGGDNIKGKGKYAHIVNAARDAGFRGDALVIAVAIAIAESGGKVDAISPVNSNGTRDYGLWQINSVHTASGFDTALGLNANYNAKWAYKISSQGRDWRPWSTYWSNPFSSGPGQGVFKQYMDEARNAITRGSPGGGTGGLDIDDMARGRRSAYDFVKIALSQAGDPYKWAAVAPVSDPNPYGFDCSELIAWAAGRVGVYMPGYSVAIMDYMRAKGTTMSIDAAIKTRGAILYKSPDSDGSGIGHVAISLGNGYTIEAAGGGIGVAKLSATNRSFRWTGAGLVPHMKYSKTRSDDGRDYTRDEDDFGTGPGA